MAITEVAYCTREDVQRALTIADVPRLNGLVDRAVQSGARSLERQLHRRFYPETKTVLFDQPHDGINLYLDELELAAAPTALLSAGAAMSAGTDFFLRPKSGPPYRWIEASYSAQVYWMSQSTPQAAISVTGDFGYPTDNVSVATLGTSITSGSATLLLSDSSQAGTGSLILIDSERMIISDRTMSSTTATITADVASAKSTVALTVSSGALLNVGESILIDSERMLIQYITGNTVTVERATSGSTLAAHTSGATIYAPRTATVLRGRLGTAAAAHSSAVTIYRLQAPSMIRDLNLALAETSVQQALGGYTRTLGQGQTSRDSAGAGVEALMDQAYVAYGRKGRSRAV
jgi:hypothetical protein